MSVESRFRFVMGEIVRLGGRLGYAKRGGAEDVSDVLFGDCGEGEEVSALSAFAREA